jgi:hypothetical protein
LTLNVEMWFRCRCDVTCPKGTYGHACLKECECETGDSDQNSTCNHVTGECRLLDEAASEYRKSNRHTTALPEIHTTVIPVTTQTDDPANSDAGIIFAPTEHSATQTDGTPLANTEKRVHFIDEKFTPALTSTSMPTVSSFLKEKAVKHEIPAEVHNSSLANITPLFDHQINEVDTETDRKETSEEVQQPETIKPEDSEGTTEDPGTTETQNKGQQVSPARRPVIVVSDGLLSERMDEATAEGTRSGVWNLVSSASVAGGVALTLIVMAIVTVLVSHRRNKAKMAVAEMATVLRQQQQPTSGPHPYNYAQDVDILPCELHSTGYIVNTSKFCGVFFASLELVFWKCPCL